MVAGNQDALVVSALVFTIVVARPERWMRQALCARMYTTRHVKSCHVQHDDCSS